MQDRKQSAMVAGFFAFLMLSGALAFGEGAKQAVIHDFKALLDPQWKTIEPAVGPGKDLGAGVSWEYRISPPFPSSWPPDRNSKLVYYAYAAGLSYQVMDGEYVAAPWGRIDVDPAGKGLPKFTRLGGKLREIGIQGVRPLAGKERAIFEKEPAVAVCLGKAGSPGQDTDDARVLRQYFCAWSAFNSRILAEIRPAHERFFAWLGCK